MIDLCWFIMDLMMLVGPLHRWGSLMFRRQVTQIFVPSPGIKQREQFAILQEIFFSLLFSQFVVFLLIINCLLLSQKFMSLRILIRFNSQSIKLQFASSKRILSILSAFSISILWRNNISIFEMRTRATRPTFKLANSRVLFKIPVITTCTHSASIVYFQLQRNLGSKSLNH